MLPDGSLPPAYLDELERFLRGYKNESSDPGAGTIVSYDPLVRLEPGLSSTELKRAEVAFGCSFPQDFRSLISRMCFTGEPWEGWREPELMRIRALNWVVGAAKFDIENNRYWHKDWGRKPRAKVEAIAVAEAYLRNAPPLLPLLGHRFLPAVPHESGNPVISMYQFVDSIYYGNDLADYFHQELGTPRPEWARDNPREVLFWSSFLI
ncbi:MAG: hypothetical protein ACRDHF_01165 [Tepidiformaceae bacterium]